MKLFLKIFGSLFVVAIAIGLGYQWFITIILGSYWNHASLVGIVVISIVPVIIAALAFLAVRGIVKL